MNPRRDFLRWASAAAIPSAVALAGDGNDDKEKGLTGTWNTVHSLPPPVGSFREFLTFGDAGVLLETNSFLHTASNLDFSAFGLPNIVNASDGQGVWSRSDRNTFRAVFRKLLFDGARQNFGDLLVTGTLQTDGTNLLGDWSVQAVDLFGKVLVEFPKSTTQGVRIR